MARPQKLNAEWFTHKGDLRNDRRVKAIRTATGMAGYGVLHCLLETLTDADNTTIPVDDFELELLAGDFGVDASQVSTVLEAGKKVGWFAIDDAQMLTCPELNKWLEMHFDKRNRSRNPRSGDSLLQPVTETPVPVTETLHSTLHNSTVQDITATSSFQSEVDAASAAAPAPVEEDLTPELVSSQLESPTPGSAHQGGAADVGTSVGDGQKGQDGQKRGQTDKPAKFVPPTYDDMLGYMVEQRPHNLPADVERVAAKCFGYYSGNGWRVGKNPMKDWKGACQTFLADLPKRAPGQPAVVVHQGGYNGAIGQRPSQVSTRAAAIAGADAMFDAVAAGQDPFANKFP